MSTIFKKIKENLSRIETKNGLKYSAMDFDDKVLGVLNLLDDTALKTLSTKYNFEDVGLLDGETLLNTLNYQLDKYATELETTPEGFKDEVMKDSERSIECYRFYVLEKILLQNIADGKFVVADDVKDSLEQNAKDAYREFISAWEKTDLKKWQNLYDGSRRKQELLIQRVVEQLKREGFMDPATGNVDALAAALAPKLLAGMNTIGKDEDKKAKIEKIINYSLLGVICAAIIGFGIADYIKADQKVETQGVTAKLFDEKIALQKVMDSIDNYTIDGDGALTEQGVAAITAYARELGLLGEEEEYTADSYEVKAVERELQVILSRSSNIENAADYLYENKNTFVVTENENGSISVRVSAAGRNKLVEKYGQFSENAFENVGRELAEKEEAARSEKVANTYGISCESNRGETITLSAENIYLGGDKIDLVVTISNVSGDSIIVEDNFTVKNNITGNTAEYDKIEFDREAGKFTIQGLRLTKNKYGTTQNNGQPGIIINSGVVEVNLNAEIAIDYSENIANYGELVSEESLTLVNGLNISAFKPYDKFSQAYDASAPVATINVEYADGTIKTINVNSVKNVDGSYSFESIAANKLVTEKNESPVAIHVADISVAESVNTYDITILNTNENWDVKTDLQTVNHGQTFTLSVEVKEGEAPEIILYDANGDVVKDKDGNTVKYEGTEIADSIYKYEITVEDAGLTLKLVSSENANEIDTYNIQSTLAYEESRIGNFQKEVEGVEGYLVLPNFELSKDFKDPSFSLEAVYSNGSATLDLEDIEINDETGLYELGMIEAKSLMNEEFEYPTQIIVKANAENIKYNVTLSAGDGYTFKTNISEVTSGSKISISLVVAEGYSGTPKLVLEDAEGNAVEYTNAGKIRNIYKFDGVEINGDVTVHVDGLVNENASADEEAPLSEETQTGVEASSYKGYKIVGGKLVKVDGEDDITSTR